MVSPHAFPPGDDVGHAVAAEADALARRGHAVTILAPGKGRQAADAGRRRIEALEAGDADAVAARPGDPPLVVATSRALRKSTKGTGRRLGGPIDSASGLEIALGMGGFDVAHLHEPLAPSPALAALRHATGVRAVTFHRTAPLAGVAFVRPLVDRALAQADIRIALSGAARHVLQGVLPGEYEVVPDGLDPALFGPASAEPGLVIVARDRDRTGLRFVLRALLGTDPAATGPITIIGPPDAPHRTRSAVPKALRDRVHVVPDAGVAARGQALRSARIALFPTEEESASPVLREAMATGLCVLAARGPDADEALGTDAGITLPSFNAQAWADAVATCLANPARVAMFGAAAEARGRALYVSEGCAYCHSQQPRDPMQAPDGERGWGRPSVPGDYVGDLPHQLGTMRTGPDLHSVGARLPSREWHAVHLYQPRAVSPWSVMPGYPYLFEHRAAAVEGDVVVAVPDEWKREPGVVVARAEALDLIAYLQSLDHTAPVLPAAEEAP